MIIRPDERKERRGHKRRIRLRLDPAQYYSDVQAGRADLYDSFNLLVRRKPEENNFRAVLETVRDLLNAPQVSLGAALPAWLQDLILGYGSPASANYR